MEDLCFVILLTVAVCEALSLTSASCPARAVGFVSAVDRRIHEFRLKR